MRRAPRACIEELELAADQLMRLLLYSLKNFFSAGEVAVLAGMFALLSLAFGLRGGVLFLCAICFVQWQSKRRGEG